MTGCVLRITGENLDPETVLSGVGIVPSAIYRKGEARTRNRVWETSGMIFTVSDAEANDLQGQIRDAIEFMQKSKGDLKFLSNSSEVSDRRLEFNVDRKKGFRQETFFPANLARLAGAFGIGIELQIFG